MDETGEHVSDTWSVIDDSCSVVSLDDDVISVASSRVDVLSLASVRTASTVRSTATTRSATAIYGDHLNEVDTAYTAGAAVPLSAIPASFIARSMVAESEESDGASLVSVNTRRGWPRVAPGAEARARPASGIVLQSGSYRDALMRQPHSEEQTQQQQQPARAAAERPAPVPRFRTVPSRRMHAGLVGGRVLLSASECHSGWVALSEEEEATAYAAFDDDAH
jgi:hypothetical protein